MYKSFYIRFILIALLACLSASGSGYRDNSVVYRNFEKKQIETYKEQRSFSYIDEEPPPGMWKRFTAVLGDLLKKLFKNIPEVKIDKGLDIFFRVLFWGLGIFAVVMILISLFRHGAFSFIIKSKDKEAEIDFENLEEQVLDTDWSVLIAAETEAQNYNAAIRLLFLQCLQVLSKQNLIQWEKDKTNADYLRELQKHNMQPDFSKLVMYYNYGWFGSFTITENDFINIHKEFNRFNQKEA